MMNTTFADTKCSTCGVEMIVYFQKSSKYMINYYNAIPSQITGTLCPVCKQETRYDQLSPAGINTSRIHCPKCGDSEVTFLYSEDSNQESKKLAYICHLCGPFWVPGWNLE